MLNDDVDPSVLLSVVAAQKNEKINEGTRIKSRFGDKAFVTDIERRYEIFETQGDNFRRSTLMQFNSITFAVFLTGVMLLFWYILNHPSRITLRNLFLLAVSYLFYGWWDWRFLTLIAASSAIDFVAGNRIGSSTDRRKRLAWLWVSIVANLGMLAAFKYFNFFLESADVLLGALGSSVMDLRLDWILPVGISFYTFQTLSYSLDIHSGRMKPVKDPVAFFAFVAFFPQLVAGPIERARDLLPQFSKYHAFDSKAVKSGLMLVVWGIFKKVVIADRLALYVNDAYANPDILVGPSAIAAVVFFTFQLYIDFSAYSEIAIGSARMMGFRLSTNFRRPLLAESFKDLWARWHISLTTWFRDYVFRPLRNLPGGRNRRALNVLIVFFLTGLWHGADWTFIIWGLLNGLYLLFFDTLVIGPMRKIPEPLSRILRTSFTTVFMYTALILFRAPDMAIAQDVFLALFDWDLTQLDANPVRLGMVEREWWMSWILLVGLFSLEILVEAKPKLEAFFSGGIGLKRWMVTWLLAMAIILLGSYGLNVLDQEFIYFQF
tara:strand:- start:1689 stop:3332 length:1644 start_codon:yes stop_codon:yes gene_type:complete